MARKFKHPVCLADPKQKRLRPKEDIKEEDVARLAETMLPIASIATLLGCHYDTLYTHFAETLQKAREGRKKSLVTAMWEEALIERNPTMMIWMSKQYLDHRDRKPDDEQGAITFNIQVNEIPR